MKPEEIISFHKHPRKEGNATFLDVNDLPETVNWVKAGAVGPVLNQGLCRAAHTFAATAAIEGAYFIKYGTLYQLSQQDCVDCDNYSYGCNGGYAENCLSYAGSGIA
jgi:C1A family cysteine protease